MYQSVQVSRSVVSDSLWPSGLQYTRFPCPSPTPRACSNSCLSSWGCRPTCHPLSSPSPLAYNLSQHQGIPMYTCISVNTCILGLIHVDVWHHNTVKQLSSNFLFCFSFIFISWRLITLQYCGGFCHILTWIIEMNTFTCVPHPEPPSHLPSHPIPLSHPSTPAPSTCLIHPTWTGDLFHTW